MLDMAPPLWISAYETGCRWSPLQPRVCIMQLMCWCTRWIRRRYAIYMRRWRRKVSAWWLCGPVMISSLWLIRVGDRLGRSPVPGHSTNVTAFTEPCGIFSAYVAPCGARSWKFPVAGPQKLPVETARYWYWTRRNLILVMGGSKVTLFVTIGYKILSEPQWSSVILRLDEFPRKKAYEFPAAVGRKLHTVDFRSFAEPKWPRTHLHGGHSLCILWHRILLLHRMLRANYALTWTRRKPGKKLRVSSS